jgi:hypothetical protein
MPRRWDGFSRGDAEARRRGENNKVIPDEVFAAQRRTLRDGTHPDTIQISQWFPDRA